MSQSQQSGAAQTQLDLRLQRAIDNFADWRARHLQVEQENSAINTALYHYTNLRGLRGIVEAGQIWFTDYRHLNDPSELIHGISIAHDVARMIASGADGRVGCFLNYLIDLYRLDNFADTLGFFIACFSRARDDLGQWRAYADNGRGIALGLSPSLFAVTDQPPPGRLPEFVGPVGYSLPDAGARNALCLEKAAELFQGVADANCELLADRSIGIPFMDEFAREVIASPLIWNCLTSKHPAYANEQEVRLVITGTPSMLSPHVTTRFRGNEVVPYIAQPIQIREPHKIAEIVVGPAAPPDTERTIRTMLKTIGVTWDIEISRSEIPYRGS